MLPRCFDTFDFKDLLFLYKIKDDEEGVLFFSVNLTLPYIAHPLCSPLFSLSFLIPPSLCLSLLSPFVPVSLSLPLTQVRCLLLVVFGSL